MIIRASLLSLGLLLPLSIFAAPEGAAPAQNAQLRELGSRITYETGQIKLRDGLATINLLPEYRFVNPAGTETILNGIWGNPPSSDRPLGMIVPAGFSPFDEDNWCVVVTYTDDGYVKDDDADSIDYNDLLKDMKEGTREASKERVKEGYPGIELVGWARPPQYDRQTHKFVWAKEIKFSDGESSENTLNYNLRVLGRGGILVLNAVASMSALPKIEAAAPDIMKMVEFNEGNRYADFKPGTDKVATYGLAALVAGGVAAKTGVIKGIFVALLAAKKFVIIGVIALVSLIGRLFGRGKASS